MLSGEEFVLGAKSDFDRIEDALDAAAYDAAKAADCGEALDAVDAAKALQAPALLAFWREKRGMTPMELAARVGATEAALADLEAGRRIAEPALLKRVAAALRLHVEDLIDA
jgi:DNA-binding XRE family transcriptional regulator